MVDLPKPPPFEDVNWAVFGLAVGTALAGGWYGIEMLKREPIQELRPLMLSEQIHQKLLSRGFKDLAPWEELIRIGKLWSVYIEIPERKEVHVRALRHNEFMMNISAHVDYTRKTAEHLKGLFENQSESYALGHRFLLAYLSDGAPPNSTRK